MMTLTKQFDLSFLQGKTNAQLMEEITLLYQQLAKLEMDHADHLREMLVLREREEKYRLLLDESSDPIFMFDPDGRYRYVNKAFAEGVGKNLEDISGHTIWDVFPKDEADKRYTVVKWVFENGETRVIEVRVPRTDGDRFYLTTAKPVLNENRKVISVICISKEITERKRMEQELQYLSTHDILTGLYNRNFFDSELARLQLSRLFPIGIVVIDMNNLKITNDRYGHTAGDELIRKVAAELKKSFRAGDVIARIGGDEFAVLLVRTSEHGVAVAVNRLRASLQRYEDPLLSISVGFAVGEDSNYLPAAVRLADDRMYQDKMAYKNEKARK